ncbi:hypothetical protein GCM10007886_51340 [Methylobacterium gregans]|uniref:Uncharacterized protein n=1 Tax=Methylobacterium gregans TaxID=374424 RepID=A0AA37HPG3_9HYPH|nr:hypothetical protein [Methylobacterium gregans]MDQ0523091.1 hypothetical protein [Methylobacterium gregans]GJD78577.1 hypothetical protein NBEOAGPD_1794 [Methylobacterium gregans]GLS56948.1 hypothetical protein GCM10007886_51340 [Methylobacterium gregans]
MRTITRTTGQFAALMLALAAPASAQVVTGGAGNTGVQAPADTGGVRPGERNLGSPAPSAGNAANPSNSAVPGTTPGVNIGGTPTSGPPGTGGAAGGPALGNR